MPSNGLGPLASRGGPTYPLLAGDGILVLPACVLGSGPGRSGPGRAGRAQDRSTHAPS